MANANQTTFSARCSNSALSPSVQFAVRLWLVCLAVFLVLAVVMVGTWIMKIAILLDTPKVMAEVTSISSTREYGTPLRNVTVQLPDRHLASLTLEPQEPAVGLGEIIPVRVVRDSARYDTFSELYEIPRIATAVSVMVLLLSPTLWFLYRKQAKLRPLEVTWFYQLVSVCAGSVALFVLAFAVRSWFFN